MAKSKKCSGIWKECTKWRATKTCKKKKHMERTGATKQENSGHLLQRLLQPDQAEVWQGLFNMFNMFTTRVGADEPLREARSMPPDTTASCTKLPYWFSF